MSHYMKAQIAASCPINRRDINNFSHVQEQMFTFSKTCMFGTYMYMYMYTHLEF